jgi:hypothetical protein
MDEIPTVEEKRKFKELLWKESDEIFFSAGMCHVFAIAMHRRYGYPLKVMQKSDGRISHAYCERNGQPFDVRGDKITLRRFFENFSGRTREITEDELEYLFSGENWNGDVYGLWGEEPFLAQSFDRAETCLDSGKYGPVPQPP